MKIYGIEYTRRDLLARTGQISQLFGVDLLTAADGPERGNRVLRFRTAAGLDFDLYLDRAMDLGVMRYLGLPFGWQSAPGFRSPWLHDPEGEDGFAWFRSASGLLTTCGLEHVHAPERDASDFGHPPQETIAHPLHGRIPFTPARLLSYGIDWQGDEATLFAEAEIRQAATFGEKLVLLRRVEADASGTTVRIVDRVRNEGFTPTPHALLWHVNMGCPLLSENSQIWAPIDRTVWRLRDEAPGESGPHGMCAPRSDTTQQVYDHRIRLEDDGTGRAALVNPDLSHANSNGIALEIGFDGKAMPSLCQWHNFRPGDYVMALEPANVPAGSRAEWRETGAFPVLGHGDEAVYWLELTPHIGAGELEALRARIGT